MYDKFYWWMRDLPPVPRWIVMTLWVVIVGGIMCVSFFFLLTMAIYLFAKFLVFIY